MSHHGAPMATLPRRRPWNLGNLSSRCSPISPRSVTEDAIDERELIEGLAVVAKIIGLCAELSVQADPERPQFFDMCSDTRMIGGPNPDGRYLLAMIRGDRAYRVTGTRGTTAYLGFQVLAGTGLTPRRMAGYVSDTELDARFRRRSRWCCRLPSRSPRVLGTAQWVPDSRGRLVDRRSRIRRRSAAEEPATMRIDPIDPAPLRRSPMTKRQHSSPRWHGPSSNWRRCTARSSPRC